MKRETGQLRATEYIDRLAARGEPLFTSLEAQAALDVSPLAVRLALHRLSRQQRVASPARGFYLVIPPEYRKLGCLPPIHFVHDLMQALGLPYYVGLLSAAQYHGAAHQRPQEFQIFLERNRLPIHCGAVSVAFVARKRLEDVAVLRLETPNGTLVVSSPEATAIDLVGYTSRAGGFSNVATVLSELAEKLDADKLAVAAATAPLPWAQRLGYLLDHLGFGAKTGPLQEYVQHSAKRWVALSTKGKEPHAGRNKEWKLRINEKIEMDR